MFDFSILITLIITILVSYLTMYMTIKKEIYDLSILSDEENNRKIKIRKKILNFINTVFILLVCVILLLFALPEDDSDSIAYIFSNIGHFLLKYLPFKNELFDNYNFRFSYITQMILSIIITLVIFCLLYEEINMISRILSSIFTIWCLIWLNIFISSFLIKHIAFFFPLLSIIFNILIYILILLIIIMVWFLIIAGIMPKFSKNTESKNRQN